MSSLDVDPEVSPIEIHVVCNDPSMQDESIVGEYYQLNDRHQFEVSIHTGLETADFRDVLAGSSDFLHYIGHVDDDGIRCPDGHLDTGTLSDVGVKAFLLNTCDTHEQGFGLVEAGSLGGIITLSDIADSVATQAGTQLARLLAAGHTLRTSIHVLRKQLLSGTRWLVIDNGNLSIYQCKSGNPLYLSISEVEDETYRTDVYTFVSPSHGLGSALNLHLDSETRYLVSGKLATLDLSERELNKILDRNLFPVDYDGDRYWSDGIVASELG